MRWQTFGSGQRFEVLVWWANSVQIRACAALREDARPSSDASYCLFGWVCLVCDSNRPENLRMTRARAALSGWQKRSTSNLPALSTAASAITLMMSPASDGNTVDLKCQHCGLPSERFNHLLSAPCGRWVHRRCRADHYPICDECQAAATTSSTTPSV